MTQRDMILRHLKDYGSITPMEAIQEYGCMRLAARISELIEDGNNIEVEMEKNRNRYGKTIHYARYTLKVS